MKTKKGLLGKLILTGFFLSVSLMSHGTFAGYLSEKNQQKNIENKINQKEDKKEVKKLPYGLLPEEFRNKIKNYQTKYILRSEPELTIVSGKLYSILRYDVNESSANKTPIGDGIFDVMEFYRVEKYSSDILGKVEYMSAKKPCAYIFNWHDINKVSFDEMLYDPKENGFLGEGGGDEKWVQEPVIEQYKEKGL